MNSDVCQELIDDYEMLQDNDPNGAFNVMKRASSLLGTLETEEADLDSQLNKFKTLAEALEAATCLESEGSISKGEKIAASNDKVIDSWGKYYNIKKEHGQITALIKYLYRIYFDTKAIWEHGTKTLKMGRD